MVSLRIYTDYIGFLLTSRGKRGFGIHSPFVFNLVTRVFNGQAHRSSFRAIEQQRKRLRSDNRTIEIKDFGTGLRGTKKSVRKISVIAKTSLKSPKQARLLFRLAQHVHAENILEIGSSLGITTSYLSKVSKEKTVFTLEGCPNISVLAKQTFDKLCISNIELVTGEFGQTLPKVLNQMPAPDFIFFDGNHQKESTIQYFELCNAYKHEGTVFVFDDIYLNPGMKEAWKIIKNHPEVSVTIDVFYMGLVFFRKGLSKQNFKVRV